MDSREESGPRPTSKETEIVGVISTLIESSADKDDRVREAVTSSLRKIAKRHPRLVLESAVVYRKQNPKMPAHHLIAVLRTMRHTCEQHEVDKDVLPQLIKFSVNEMTLNKDYHPELQMPASGILVALGHTCCTEVMEALLCHFQPGVLPHYAVLHTMGALASANAFGIVPFVKATLGTMLPIMGMLKTEAMKQVFAYTLGKFSEAVLEYLANIDKAPDPSVNKEAYTYEINIAYDVIVNTWLNTRDAKVCETVLKALGPMFSLLSQTKVSEQTPRLIPTLMHLYRRNFDPYPVTNCMAMILPIIFQVNQTALEPLMDNFLTVMFEQVCSSSDYAQPATVKNHNEVLRCFDQIAIHFSDRLVDLLIHQLKNNNERERIKALLVVTHLVNSSDNLIGSRIPDLLFVLKNMLSETSVKVKKVMLKPIVAFTYRGCLAGDDAHLFVEFIVRNCCPIQHSAVVKDNEKHSKLEELDLMCANTLYLLTTTVPQFENTLWPLLLRFLVTSQYTAACPTITMCVAHLAGKRKEQFLAELADDIVESPCPIVVLGRCIALLGNPLQMKLGTNILMFLKNYAIKINRILRPLWELRIPELIQFIKESSSKWSEVEWEELVMEFLSATLREVDEEKWTLDLGVKMVDQTPLYSVHTTERGMHYQCLAVITCHTSNKEFINLALKVIVGSTRQHSTQDSKSCARALGVCARSHTELVLQKLELLAREELSRKSSRLLGFMKDPKQEIEVERVRLTLLLAYGQVAIQAPSIQLLPYIQKIATTWVIQQLQVAKDLLVRTAALNTLAKIAISLHHSGESQQVLLSSRGQILDVILNQFQDRHRHLFPTILHTATAYLKLSPSVAAEERSSVARTCFEHVFELVAEDGEGEDHAVNGMTNILDGLALLVRELLLPSVTPATLDDIFSILEPWFSKPNAQQRLASINILRNLLQCYLDNLKFTFENPSKFSQCGVILGHVVPRCTDGWIATRGRAIDCVGLTLCIAARYEGHTGDLDGELQYVKQYFQTDDPDTLFKATTDLAQIISVKLPRGQLLHFTESLLSGLLDPQPTSSSGTSVIFNVFLKVKGGELYHHVSEILLKILDCLAKIQCTQTHTGCMRGVLALANHHPKAVVSMLLRQPIPYDTSVAECWAMLAQDTNLSADIIEQFLCLCRSVAECWAMLAQDTNLSADIIEQFLQIISTTPLYEDQKDKEKLRIAVLLPLSAISALEEMFRVVSVQEYAIKRFPELFSAFLIAVGSYIGASPPIYTMQQANTKHAFVPNRNAYKLNPARVALEAFKSFLLCAKCEGCADTLLYLNHVELGESLASFIEMMPYLAKALCRCKPQEIPKLIVCLNQYGNSVCDPQRIVLVAFSAELAHLRSNDDYVLMESLVNNLLNSLSDPSPVVRRLCLKGLSAVSLLKPEQRGRYMEPVISAFIQGLDDQDLTNSDSVPLEAMKGFSKMLEVMEEESVHDVQVPVALRIKPFYEKENENIRAAVFQMFGDLARSGGSKSKGAFLEQVNNSLLCLLLHVDDNEDSVIRACKYALRQVTPLLGAEKTNDMMQNHLIDEARLHYSDFMADIVKILVDELPDLPPLLIMHALSYIKSSNSKVRGNATMFIGLLCGNWPTNAEKMVPLETVCARLISLLKDQNSTVRTKAAQAMSCVFMNS